MTVRIAAWSGPRNLSTAMMRAWENRPDTTVLDEPLYAASLVATGADHPMRAEVVAAGPTDPAVAIERCLAPLPDGITISYQKQMAHHLLPSFDRAWLDELWHLVLVRDPRRVLASYTKVWDEVTVADIGLPQQLELAERAELIIDSDDFLGNPAGYLAAICGAAGVAFDETMLAWPPGTRSSDGVWAPAWYEAVEASTGFGPPPTEPPPPLPAHLVTVAAEAEAIYRELYAGRLVL